MMGKEKAHKCVKAGRRFEWSKIANIGIYDQHFHETNRVQKRINS